jgi:hypothetical protein
MGRKTRTVSGSLRRALHMRDQTCQFPGCTQRHHTDAHHVEHWADGGATNLDNVLRLCRFHHMLVHDGGFDVRRTPHGEFEFFDPRGNVIPQAPRQQRGDCQTLRTSNYKRGSTPTAASLWPPDNRGENVDLSWSVDALLETRAGPRFTPPGSRSPV